MGAVTIGVFLAALDAYVVVTLLPRMVADLGLPADHLERATPVITGFLLGYVVTMPLMGAISDAHGRGRVYCACLGLFAVGSVVTATAGLVGSNVEPLSIGPLSIGDTGMPWLVAGRVIQGLGGGALVPVALAVTADLYTAGGRAAALGAVAAVQEVGSVLGPLYGAVIALALGWLGGWRAVFWVNLPLVVLCVVMYLLATRGTTKTAAALHRPGASGTASTRTHVDWWGGALLGLGLGLLVLALYPDDPSVRATGPDLVPLGAAAIALLCAYGWHTARGAQPLVRPALLRDRAFVGACVANFLVGAALIVALVDVPILGRGVYGMTQLGAALLLFRFMVAIPIGALGGGWLTRRLGARAAAIIGLLAAAAAFVAMARWGPGDVVRTFTGVRVSDVVLGLGGLGFGLVIAPLTAVILDRSGHAEHGVASSVAVLARTVGMIVGLSALTSFGLHRFFELFRAGPPLQLIPGPGLALAQAAYEARLRGALAAEYHEVFNLAAVVCVVAAATAAVTIGRRLPGSPEPADRLVG